MLENGLSDVHNMICGILKIANYRQIPKTITYHSYKSLDEDQLNNDILNAPFHVGSVFDSTDDKYWFFHTLYRNIIDEHLPLKSKKVRPTQPPFMNSVLRKNVNRKAQFRNRYNRFPTRQNWEIYRLQRNRTNQIRKQSIKNYLIEKCSGKADKSFYNTIRPLVSLKSVTTRPTQLLENGSLIRDQRQIADIMNCYFTNIADDISTSTNSNILTNDIPDDLYVDKCIDLFKDHESICKITQTVSDISSFSFSEVNVSSTKRLLKNTVIRKATGYDLIPPKILKLNAETIAYPLTCLINDMFRTSTFPSMLKCAEIGPLHKKQSMLDKANFRPLSVLTAISKIFEKNIDIQIKTHSELVFSHLLSAYRKQFSTQHVLIQVTENIRKCLDNKNKCGLVLMDLSKAFDALPHDFIVAKLCAYKFEKNSAMLISSYLRHRLQRVKLTVTGYILRGGYPKGR